MQKVICNQKHCEHREECGGAKPHWFDPYECNMCPMCSRARCVTYHDEEEVINSEEDESR